MKKRFLIMALAICLCGTFASCKKKPIPEEKPKDGAKVGTANGDNKPAADGKK